MADGSPTTGTWLPLNHELVETKYAKELIYASTMPLACLSVLLTAAGIYASAEFTLSSTGSHPSWLHSSATASLTIAILAFLALAATSIRFVIVLIRFNKKSFLVPAPILASPVATSDSSPQLTGGQTSPTGSTASTASSAESSPTPPAPSPPDTERPSPDIPSS